jgi:hypothetical protein
MDKLLLCAFCQIGAPANYGAFNNYAFGSFDAWYFVVLALSRSGLGGLFKSASLFTSQFFTSFFMVSG